MAKQYQIKISVSKKLYNLINNKAKQMGVKRATYCFNILFEHLRKEVDSKDE